MTWCGSTGGRDVRIRTGRFGNLSELNIKEKEILLGRLSGSSG